MKSDSLELVCLFEQNNISVEDATRLLKGVSSSMEKLQNCLPEFYPDVVEIVIELQKLEKRKDLSSLELKSKKMRHQELLKKISSNRISIEALEDIENLGKVLEGVTPQAEHNTMEVPNVAIEKEEKKGGKHNDNQKRRSPPLEQWSIGLVKFYDAKNKHVGVLTNIESEKEILFHKNDIVTGETLPVDGSYVVFKERQNSKKVFANHIYTKIDAFLFHNQKENATYGYFCYFGADKILHKINKKHETGFVSFRAAHGTNGLVLSYIESRTEPLSNAYLQLCKKVFSSELEKAVVDPSLLYDLSKLLYSEVIFLTEGFNTLITKIENEGYDTIAECLTSLKENEKYINIPIKKLYELSRLNLYRCLTRDKTLPIIPSDIGDEWEQKYLNGLGFPQLMNLIEKCTAIPQILGIGKRTYQYLISLDWSVLEVEAVQLELECICEKYIGKFRAHPIPDENLRTKAGKALLAISVEKGKPMEVSDEILVGFLADKEVSATLKDKWLKMLPFEKLLALEGTQGADEFIQSVKQHYFRKRIYNLNCLCFDLEWNGEHIFEHAWAKKGITYSHVDMSLGDLVTAIKSSKFTIGQNIREFDLPLLQKNSATKINCDIWDTLEVELILEPTRPSYGFSSNAIAHKAVSDCEATYRLFENQFSRICADESLDINILEGVVPHTALLLVSEFRRLHYFKKADLRALLTDANTFFRPEQATVVLPDELSEPINDTDRNDRVVVAPKLLWPLLASYPNMAFYSQDEYAYVLSQEIIIAQERIPTFLKSSLLRFCERKGPNAYYECLPSYTRSLLSEIDMMGICDKVNIVLGGETRNIVVSLTDLEGLISTNQTNRDTEIIVLEKELYHLTQKEKLGGELDAATLFDTFKSDFFWFSLPSGKGVVPITESQCKLLGIGPLPTNYKGLWLERKEKNSYQIYYNVDFEKLLETAKIKEYKAVHFENRTSIEAVTKILEPNQRTESFTGLDQRTNPETLNRCAYWHYQFKLFAGYPNDQKPLVLLVHDEQEIESLVLYATKTLGFYVPANEATIARRLELLHKDKRGKKLLVVGFERINEVLAYNYLGPLCFVWDSFLLNEKQEMLKGVNKLLWTKTDEGEQEESISLRREDSKGKATNFQLIKAHTSLIQHYGSLIVANDPNSRLLLCDARIVDYKGIQIGAGSQAITMWKDEDDYKNNYERAKESRCFDSHERNVELAPDNLDKVKNLLAAVFLGSGKDWRDYQDTCLDQILPAPETRKNYVISIPTGGGKSFLFQAPALYRSSLSGKLSLVVTPLRALMQDQVAGLEGKGIFTGVEYLSSDKSPQEISDIYRRICGGEITLLYITPERFRAKAFINSLLMRLDSDQGLEYFVFDEAHCISQWGQEFRPDYMYAAKQAQVLSQKFGMAKLLFSATISGMALNEIRAVLPDVEFISGIPTVYNPVQDHIRMTFVTDIAEDKRLDHIVKYLHGKGFNFLDSLLSKAIVFVSKKRAAEDLARGIIESIAKKYGCEQEVAKQKTGYFHAGMDFNERKEVYERFKNNELSLLFATKAFGMGMDIDNIHYLVHYSPPNYLEDYLQEVGRAGRKEEAREAAGFNNDDNPIEALCFADTQDFSKITSLQNRSSFSWNDVVTTGTELKTYILRNLPQNQIQEGSKRDYLPIPFNFETQKTGQIDDNKDQNFRMKLHWLEQADEMELRYFAPTHLSFLLEYFTAPPKNINTCRNADIKELYQTLKYLIEILEPEGDEINILIPIQDIKNRTGFSNHKLFATMQLAHKGDWIGCDARVTVTRTQIRQEELNYFCTRGKTQWLIDVLFNVASEILKGIRYSEEKEYTGGEIEQMLKSQAEEVIPRPNPMTTRLPWIPEKKPVTGITTYDKYEKDLISKRLKFVFMILEMTGPVRVETRFLKTAKNNSLLSVNVYNGHTAPQQWRDRINAMKSELLSALQYFNTTGIAGTNSFNLYDLLEELDNTTYHKLSRTLTLANILGYLRSSSFMPTGVEIAVTEHEEEPEEEETPKINMTEEKFKLFQRMQQLKTICLRVLTGISAKDEQDKFIKAFFDCKSETDIINMLGTRLSVDDQIMKEFHGNAIKYQEDHRLNTEQRLIYDVSTNHHISVVAGPGSGKTHTLNLRVARLIHHLKVNPNEILVLAYNRAVVNELKTRLRKLFSELGYKSAANSVQILTFHAAARRFAPQATEGKDMDTWEKALRDELKERPGDVLQRTGILKHILVDEFQDIDDTRLEILQKFHELTQAKIFIIGDPNQSIYGYAREVMDPMYYYGKFNEMFKPIQLTLRRNHRSLPQILEISNNLLNIDEANAPEAVLSPVEGFMPEYAKVIDTLQDPSQKWWEKIEGLQGETYNGKTYSQVAVLFTSNNEVYKGYQRLRGIPALAGVRIRIQGGLAYGFTKIRECHAIVKYIQSLGEGVISENFKGDLTTRSLAFCAAHPNWNRFYIEVICGIALEYLENETDEPQTYQGLLEYINDLTKRDDGQLIKFKEKHFPNDNDREIVLSTQHKVKGLEFDCVVVAPSFLQLAHNTLDAKQKDDEIREAKRLHYVAFTRAKLRLLSFEGKREQNLRLGLPYEGEKIGGIPASEGLKKIQLSWSAKDYNFNKQKVNDYIKSHVNSGDKIMIKSRWVAIWQNFTYEIFKAEEDRAIGVLSKDEANKFLDKAGADSLAAGVRGFVVNEVVAWTYEETLASDAANGTTYAQDWCPQARTQGYVYLVDFAGYGEVIPAT